MKSSKFLLIGDYNGGSEMRLCPCAVKTITSTIARHHGGLRRFQGYSPAMLIEESTLLEVSIFKTVAKGAVGLDLTVALADVVIIADERGWQLEESVCGYFDPGGYFLDLDHLPSAPDGQELIVSAELHAAVKRVQFSTALDGISG
jgi:hypothetical protein